MNDHDIGTIILALALLAAILINGYGNNDVRNPPRGGTRITRANSSRKD